MDPPDGYWSLASGKTFVSPNLRQILGIGDSVHWKEFIGEEYWELILEGPSTLQVLYRGGLWMHCRISRGDVLTVWNHNITEVKKLQQNLENIEESVDTHISRTIHEFNHYFGVMHGFLDILKVAPNNPHALKIMESSLFSVENVSKRLLDYNRIRQGPKQFPVWLSIGDMVHEYAQKYEIKESVEHLSEVFADRALMGRIIDNICSNVARYGNKQLYVTGNDKIINFKDGGKGFTEQQLEKVGTPFTKFGGSRTSGLGISIMKEAARQMGFILEVSSNGCACFTLNLDPQLPILMVGLGHELVQKISNVEYSATVKMRPYRALVVNTFGMREDIVKYRNMFPMVPIIWFHKPNEAAISAVNCFGHSLQINDIERVLEDSDIKNDNSK
jgi:signal transduction histidine kinase